MLVQKYWWHKFVEELLKTRWAYGMMKVQAYLVEINPLVRNSRLFNTCIVQVSVPEQQRTFYQANHFHELYKDKFQILVYGIHPAITHDWNKVWSRQLLGLSSKWPFSFLEECSHSVLIYIFLHTAPQGSKLWLTGCQCNQKLCTCDQILRTGHR